MLLQSKSYAFPSERGNYRNMKAVLKENEGFSFQEWVVRWKKTKKQKERECSDSLSFCQIKYWVVEIIFSISHYIYYQELED